MARLLVLVEGQTEEEFVKEVLKPYLLPFGYSRIDATLLGNARKRSKRGGIRPWYSARKDIEGHLREDSGITVALMVDYYALPQCGTSAWPGRAAATGADDVERALRKCIGMRIGQELDCSRFVPCVMMHEFEAMLFSDCEKFAEAIDCPGIISGLRSIRDRFPNPEAINDSLEGAPSKRIAELVPNYEKVLWGNVAALGIGIECIQAAGPHFRNWLERLKERAYNSP